MSLGARVGVVFSNIAILIPVFILLLVTAIMSSDAAANLADLTGVSRAHRYVSWTTVTLWLLFVGGLLFAFTIGLFIIPIIVANQYLYGSILFLFAILNLVLAGFLLYGSIAARESSNYKNPSDKHYSAAKSAYRVLLVCSLMMVIASIFMGVYAVWTIHSYYKSGGITGDIALAGKAAALVAAPEIAIPLGAAGSIAEKNLSPTEQTTLAQNTSQLNTLSKLFSSATSGENASGIANLLKNPQLVGAITQALA